MYSRIRVEVPESEKPCSVKVSRIPTKSSSFVGICVVKGAVEEDEEEGVEEEGKEDDSPEDEGGTGEDDGSLLHPVSKSRERRDNRIIFLFIFVLLN